MTDHRIVNGCRVRARVGDAVIIKHPNTGWQVYRSWRVGIRKTLRGAISLARRTA